MPCSAMSWAWGVITTNTALLGVWHNVTLESFSQQNCEGVFKERYYHLIQWVLKSQAWDNQEGKIWPGNAEVLMLKKYYWKYNRVKSKKDDAKKFPLSRPCPCTIFTSHAHRCRKWQENNVLLMLVRGGKVNFPKFRGQMLSAPDIPFVDSSTRSSNALITSAYTPLRTVWINGDSKCLH